MSIDRAKLNRLRRKAGRSARQARDLLQGGSRRAFRRRFGRDQARPRVGLVGYFGWGNYGDELFHEVYKEHLGPALNLGILYDRTAKPYFDRPVADAVAEVDAIIIGGGDLVIPWKMSALYWNPEYLAKPVFISGVGVPVSSANRPQAAVVEQLRAFFQHPSVRWISARDEESAAWIEKHLAPSVPVRRTADLVCALTLPEVEPTEDVLGVVTRYRPRNEDDYTQVAALAQHAQKQGMRVRHLILATGTTGTRDFENATDLDVEGKEVVYSESLDDLSRAIGQCRVLASMKFHGSVVASMYGVPSIVLMPTAKNRRYYNRLGRPELVRHFTNENLSDLIDPLPERIDPGVVAQLRADAAANLADLRAEIVRTARESARA